MTSLERELRDIIGARHVLADPDVTMSYGTDWTGRWSTRPRLVIRPETVEEVVAVVKACARHQSAIVPQGGNTGLVGGSVPRSSEEVILSTARLTMCETVDVATRQVTVGAGVSIRALQQHARASGLLYGVDLASRDTATIGGTVATNAGGVRVVRYGDTRAQIAGIQAVLADGSIVDRLAGLPKDSSGYDLNGLLVGSEGTLAVVTAVRVRLRPIEDGGECVLVGCSSFAVALSLLPGRGVRAAEVMTSDGVALVREVANLPRPLNGDWPVYLLMEVDKLDLLDLPDDVDAVVDSRVWEYRERQTEAVATLGVPHKLDVAVPVARLDDFVAEVGTAVTSHKLVLWGHLAEGNLHVNVIGPDPDDYTIDHQLLEIVAAYHGSISAEHGVGTAKSSQLHLSRSAAEIQAMRAIKSALDPQNILNPGVIFS